MVGPRRIGAQMVVRKNGRTRIASTARSNSKELPLRTHTERALIDYFASLNGHRPGTSLRSGAARGRGTAAEGRPRLHRGQPGTRLPISWASIAAPCARNCACTASPADIPVTRPPAGRGRPNLMLQTGATALISVSDKSGAVALARALATRGVELLSTDGTRPHAARSGLDGARGRRLHRLSRNDGRAHQDPCIRRSTAACWAAAAPMMR